jgi:hypothetical protein
VICPDELGPSQARTIGCGVGLWDEARVCAKRDSVCDDEMQRHTTHVDNIPRWIVSQRVQLCRVSMARIRSRWFTM